MPLADTPAAEVEVTPALVQTLLVEQHPDLAVLPIVVAASGWDNVLCRLGDDLVARLPRRAAAAPLVDQELRWLPTLAPRLPLPTSAPLRRGAPAPHHGYPWVWTIGPWLPGVSALVAPPVDPRTTAHALGAFLTALHAPAPSDAPRNPFRGVPLAARQELFATRLDQLHDLVDRGALRSRWDELVEAPPWDRPPVWVHGDVHPGNLLIDHGELSAVIDWGDLCQGDPASDLAVGWMLFEDADRRVFRDACHLSDDATWARAHAWALALGVAILASSADAPAMAGLGHRTLDRALRDRS